MKQFCRAGNSLKIPIKNQTASFPYPTHPDLRFTYNVDIYKINLHTGKIGTGKKKEMQPRFKINLFKIFTAEGHQILQPDSK